MTSYLSTHADVTDPRFTGHVWRDNDGQINATVDIAPKTGGILDWWLAFDDPAAARGLAAACIEAAEAMEALAAEPVTAAPDTPEGGLSDEPETMPAGWRPRQPQP